MGVNSLYFRIHFDFYLVYCCNAQLFDLVTHLWEFTKNSRNSDFVLKSVCFKLLRVK